MTRLALVGFGAAFALGATACTGMMSNPDGGGMDAISNQDSASEANANCSDGLMIMAPAATTCYRAEACNAGPFCPNLVTNNPQTPDFLLQEIDVTTPATLASGSLVGNLLATAIAGSKFLWGASLDFTGSGTLRTGAMSENVTPQTGTGVLNQPFMYINGAAPVGDGGSTDPHRWDPVMTTATITGDTFTSGMVQLITIPVYNPDGTALLAELPLRDCYMHDVAMVANRNCIGLVKANINYNSCAKSQWTTHSIGTDGGTQSSGVLEGNLTVADAMGIPIMGAGSLCDVISGATCATAAQSTWPHQPDSMINGATSPNAWHLVANFAAVAANITN